jgi:hypothetical protein
VVSDVPSPTATEKSALLAEARAKAAELLAKLELLAEMEESDGGAGDDGNP